MTHGKALPRAFNVFWAGQGLSAIGDAIFQITGKRYRDLPYGKHDLSWT